MDIDFSVYLNCYEDSITVTDVEGPIVATGSLEYYPTTGTPETGDYDPGYLAFNTITVEFFGEKASDRAIRKIQEQLFNQMDDIIKFGT